MKKHSYILLMACAAIAGAALLESCSKEGGISLNGPIQFGMVSRGTLTTKTVYGKDYLEGEGEDQKATYQSLDWVAGDLITIASPQALVQNDASANPARAADYKISTVLSTGTATDHQSKAKVVNADANGLMYDDSYKGSYDFYAIYPNHSEGRITLTEAGAVSATIPATQTLKSGASKEESKKYTIDGETVTKTIKYTVYDPDMQFAFMTAALEEFAPKDEQQTIPLTFTPAFTAFEFNVSSQDDEIELTKFEILSPDNSDKLAGTFNMTAGTLPTSAPNATSSVTVDMTKIDGTNPAPKINQTNGLTFTVFTVPVENTKPLRIKFTSKDGENATKTSWLDLQYNNGENAGNPVKFLAGHKYRIHMLKLPSSQWKITITAVYEDWVKAEEEVVIYI